MTPGQARVALLSFFLLASGVAINALLLQDRPQTASKAVVDQPMTRSGAERARKPAAAAKAPRTSQPAPAANAEEHPHPHLRIARFAPDPARLDALPELPAAQADAETVRAIQRELGQRGYGGLNADGVLGLATRAAIMAFEHDHKVALTGEASEVLLKRILLGASASADVAGAGKVRSAEAEQIVRDVQQRLAALGYQVGRVDGRLGEDTVRAIRDFEVDRGLVPRGRISAEVVQRLEAAVAPPARTSGR